MCRDHQIAECHATVVSLFLHHQLNFFLRYSFSFFGEILYRLTAPRCVEVDHLCKGDCCRFVKDADSLSVVLDFFWISFVKLASTLAVLLEYLAIRFNRQCNTRSIKSGKFPSGFFSKCQKILDFREKCRLE